MTEREAAERIVQAMKVMTERQRAELVEVAISLARSSPREIPRSAPGSADLQG